MQRPAASVLGAAALQAARRRPVEDLLARCKLSSKRPRVATLGGMSEVAPLLLAKWPECSHEHTDAVALPTDTPTFDLVITGTPGPVHLAQLLERVSPGGALAMVVSDAPAEQLAVLRDAAAGLGQAVEAAPPQRGPELYCDALLGPLCASLDIWRTTYTHRLQDVEAAVVSLSAAGYAPDELSVRHIMLRSGRAKFLDPPVSVSPHRVDASGGNSPHLSSASQSHALAALESPLCLPEQVHFPWPLQSHLRRR